jgi:hypothetical protein
LTETKLVGIFGYAIDTNPLANLIEIDITGFGYCPEIGRASCRERVS